MRKYRIFASFQGMKTNKAEKYDVQEIMARIRSEVRGELEGVDLPNSSSLSPETSAQGGLSPLIYSEELNYLNHNWGNLNHGSVITSHRPIVGPVIVFLKRVMAKAGTYLLGDYFEAERKFNSNLVRHLNANAKYTDERLKEVFWQLVDKIDQEVTGLNSRTDSLVALLERHSCEERDELHKEIGSLKSKLEVLEEIRSAKGVSLDREVGLRKISDSSHLPPIWRQSIAELNALVEQINSKQSQAK